MKKFTRFILATGIFFLILSVPMYLVNESGSAGAVLSIMDGIIGLIMTILSVVYLRFLHRD